MTQKLSHPSVGLVDGTLVDVLDESQGDFKMKLKITHRCCISCLACHHNVACYSGEYSLHGCCFMLIHLTGCFLSSKS